MQYFTSKGNPFDVFVFEVINLFIVIASILVHYVLAIFILVD